MSARNGDRSRHNRIRKANIKRRETNRALREQPAAGAPVAKAKSTKSSS